MATTNDPIKNVSDLSLSELQTIVRRAQETLWLDDGTGKWRAREDWSEGDSAYVLLTYIADLLAEYDLEPIEEGEPDEPEEPVDGDLWTEDHHKLWEFGMHRPKPAVVVPEGEDWEPRVANYMDEQKFWPNVWHVSDHGNWLLLDMAKYHLEPIEEDEKEADNDDEN